MKTKWPDLKCGCLILASLTLPTSAPAQTQLPTSAGKSAAAL